MAFWQDSGLCGRNSYVHSRCRNSQKRRSVTILDRQNAAVGLICGVEIPRVIFWHASGSSNGCLPTGQFPQWK
eukprot:6460539-Pyramimonas_sp.AAC.1